MKTIGIGVDIIDNNRIKSLLKNKNFINRTFSKREMRVLTSLSLAQTQARSPTSRLLFWERDVALLNYSY